MAMGLLDWHGVDGSFALPCGLAQDFGSSPTLLKRFA
jgi:hypothetical protein